MFREVFDPFVGEQQRFRGLSYGPGPAGYDIRVNVGRPSIVLKPQEHRLAVSVERFTMPNDRVAIVHDKSTWARQGLSVYNTVIEPGWRGWLTLELVNHSYDELVIDDGMPIAQIMFHLVQEYRPYNGKYQDAPADGPEGAKLEDE